MTSESSQYLHVLNIISCNVLYLQTSGIHQSQSTICIGHGLGAHICGMAGWSNRENMDDPKVGFLWIKHTSPTILSTCEYIASEIITSYFLQGEQNWGISRNNNDDTIDLPRSRMVEWNLVDGKNDNEQTINNRFPSDKLYPTIQRMRSPQDVRHILFSYSIICPSRI